MEDTPHSEDEQSESSDNRTGSEATREPELHSRRAALYGYVATALQFPDETTVADLTDDEVQDAVREAAAHVGFEDELDALLDALDGADHEDLEAAYNRLFGLPEDGTYPVVPYEAHYTAEGDVSDTQRRIATVVGLLEAFDLEPSDAFDERQDHVAVELELLQVLAAQRSIATERGDDDGAVTLTQATATVLDEHLSPFVPSLAHDMGGTADHDDTGEAVYVAAIDLAAALVEFDAASHPDPVRPAAAPGEVTGDA